MWAGDAWVWTGRLPGGTASRAADRERAPVGGVTLACGRRCHGTETHSGWMPGVAKKGRPRRTSGKPSPHTGRRSTVAPPACEHQRNEKDRVGECQLCGGPTPYCLECDVCFCEWCEV